MSKADIIMEINFNIKEPSKTVIKTNARREAVSEILEAWIFSQIGQGKDSRESNKKNEYTIVIKLDLSDDTFSTDSDTGNKGLTCGIVIHVFNSLVSGEPITIADLF